MSASRRAPGATRRSPAIARARTRLAASLACLALLVACGHDAADTLYLDALRGEETGWTREQQIAALDRAISLEPKREAYWSTRAGYRTDLRDFEGATADLDRAIVLGDRPYLYFQRGLVLCERGRFVEALADFDNAIATQPENTQFYRGRALARIAAGMPEKALEDADHLVAVVPQQAESHHARGRALAALGRCAEAIPCYDEALRRRPELVYTLRARADCLEELGETARAARDREEAASRAVDHGGCAPCNDPFRY